MAESIATSVGDSLFGMIKKEIGYMWNYTQNVEKLKHEAKKLKEMRVRIQEKIERGIRKGEKISGGVEDWVKEAATEISKADEFLQQEDNAKIGLCGNWGTLHRRGKSATTMALSVVRLQERGGAVEDCVSYEVPPHTQLDTYRKRNLEDLGTHNLALKDIIAALEDDSIQIIGIYGLGGVGKTTLAKEVVSRVKNNLFAHVAFTTVSHNVDVEKIRKDLKNATDRIMNGDKILIILDDVWEILNLEAELRIPCGSEHVNCKILLTSRNDKIFHHMNVDKTVPVNCLTAEEAWILFKRFVGETVETEPGLKPVALKVVEECGGLPLLIEAVGNALKGESLGSWNRALTQLQNHVAGNFDGQILKAYATLELSYDRLKDENDKWCFLLCSLFPEDSYVNLDNLALYVVGLKKFNNIKEARDMVHIAAKNLKSSGLLLKDEVDRENFAKMHDVVRDVALFIASKGDNKYLVDAGKGLTEWVPEESRLESCTGISLMYNKISKLRDYEVHLSSLDIFLVNNNYGLSMISDKFIEGMKELKVFDMEWCCEAQVPQSLNLLTKLRMLNVAKNTNFHDISMLGEMKELEILILNGTGIKEIPQEIGQLVKLRRLELVGCKDMTRVTPGVISRLRSLEELCIDFSKVSKGVKGCIAEIMELWKLTYLDLTVKSLNLIPEGFNSENLKGFLIQIGFNCPGNNMVTRSEIVISSEHLVIPLLKWLKKLIQVSRPRIFLYEIHNLNNIMPTLYDEGFNKLEHIRLQLCSNVLCLVDDSTWCVGDEGKTSEKYFMELKTLELVGLHKLEVLWKCPDEYISLNSLVSLEIRGCRLERVFTVSVAKGLVNLKDLYIESCSILKEVIWGGDDESGSVIEFPLLTKIYLRYLPNLKSFFNSAAGNCSIEYPSLVDVVIYGCKSMEIWGRGIHKTPDLKTLLGNDAKHVLDGSCAINEAVAKVYELEKEKEIRSQSRR